MSARSCSIAGQRCSTTQGDGRSFRIPPASDLTRSAGYRLDRQTGFLPGRPTSGEGSCSLPSRLSQFLRHPGAGRFVRSGTVGDQPGLPRQTELLRSVDHVVGRQADRSGGLMLGPFVAAFGPHVQNLDRFVSLPQPL